MSGIMALIVVVLFVLPDPDVGLWLAVAWCVLSDIVRMLQTQYK